MIFRPYLINSSKSTARGEGQEKLEKTVPTLKKKKSFPHFKKSSSTPTVSVCVIIAPIVKQPEIPLASFKLALYL